MSRITFAALAAALILTACSAGTVPIDSPAPRPIPVTEAHAEPTPEQPVAVAEPEPPPPSPFETLAAEAHLDLDLVELAHLAERSHDGAMLIDMGTMSARKHTNGGWRSGFDPTRRHSDGESWLEADSKTSRVFFKHKKDGFESVVVRMRASSKKKNSVTVYLNDTAIETVDLTEAMTDFTFAMPDKARRDGENELMFRFRSKPTVDGRGQAAHLASVAILPHGAKLDDAPRGDAVAEVNLGGVKRKALLSTTPQTWTHRLFVPDRGAPRLAVAWGAGAPGAALTIIATSDLTPTRTLLSTQIDDAAAGSWHEELLDLTPFAGQVIELDLTSANHADPGQIVAWGQLGLWTDRLKDEAIPPTAGDKPAMNLLIYLIDTMRYDKFAVYREKTAIETPNINAFARDATLFEFAYDNENWTKPSTATIWTGLYPDTHKAKEDGSKLPEGVTTLSEHLKGQGFKTGSFIANGYVSDAFGFKQGWDHYRNYIREETRTDADRVVDDAFAWIDAQKGERFFAYLHTIDPHVPYSPPGPYKKMYWDKPYGGWLRAQSTGDQIAEIKSHKHAVTDVDKAYLESLYNGEVTFNDHEFGRLFKGLEERGLADDTLIAIVADHGEEFWDHGSVGHGHSLYEELLHSPMIIRYPGRLARGRRIPRVVSMVDLAPTLAETLGVSALPEAEGVSFADTFAGGGAPRPYLAVSDFLFRIKCFHAGHYSWITGGTAGDLFDVVADPNQKKDLLKRHFIARAYIRGLAGQFLGASDKTTWWQNTDRDGKLRSFDAESINAAAVDPELREQLEAMGYVEGTRVVDDAKKDAPRKADPKPADRKDK